MTEGTRRWQPGDVATTVSDPDGSPRLTGTKEAVLSAAEAGLLVVAARAAAGGGPVPGPPDELHR